MEIQFTDNAVADGIEAANDPNFAAGGDRYCYGISLRFGIVIGSKNQPDIGTAAAHANGLHEAIRAISKQADIAGIITRALVLSDGVSRVTITVQSGLEAVITEDRPATD